MSAVKSKFTSALDFLIAEDSDAHSESEESEIDTEDEDELLIFEFYGNLIDTLMSKFSVSPFRIKAAIQHLGYNYRNIACGQTPEELDYNNMDLCLAYLHRYAVCHAALVRCVMIKILYQQCPVQMGRTLTVKKLHVVSLGGGPGNDFVGFLSALYGEHTQLSDLDVTIVDKMTGWKNVFTETVQKLKHGECGEASLIFQDLNVTHRFIRADLKKSTHWSNEMKGKLGNADIVFLVKVLSNIPDSDKVLILKDIVNCLKLGALLIYIDCPYPYWVFSNLSYCLHPIYQQFSMESFKLNLKRERFGHYNITASTAYVRVFEKRGEIR